MNQHDADLVLIAADYSSLTSVGPRSIPMGKDVMHGNTLLYHIVAYFDGPSDGDGLVVLHVRLSTTAGEFEVSARVNSLAKLRDAEEMFNRIFWRTECQPALGDVGVLTRIAKSM